MVVGAILVGGIEIGWQTSGGKIVRSSDSVIDLGPKTASRAVRRKRTSVERGIEDAKVTLCTVCSRQPCRDRGFVTQRLGATSEVVLGKFAGRWTR